MTWVTSSVYWERDGKTPKLMQRSSIHCVLFWYMVGLGKKGGMGYTARTVRMEPCASWRCPLMNLDLQSGLLQGTAAICFRVWGEGGRLCHGPVGFCSCALTNVFTWGSWGCLGSVFCLCQTSLLPAGGKWGCSHNLATSTSETTEMFMM